MANRVLRLLTTNVDSVLLAIALLLAFVASGVLDYLAFITAQASVPSPMNGVAGWWLIMCFSPFWLGLCLLAIICGHKLKGAWQIVGWLPLIFGILGGLLIDAYFGNPLWAGAFGRL